ncbi:Co2+/Mg2+ efflux protein ApaG [Bdellovibrio sp. HCB337]|uniref:Co2+/Mg2+ efflux protein ApaG n=1 Tax=Bdellovibrio sp. HCB337 TaxID=3394358 RepID=UPI0039A67161
MPIQKSMTPHIQVAVTTVYVPAESRPEQNYHFFAYKISIKNTGARSAQLMSRHWVITDALGRTEDVRGPGVVGLQPKIAAGQTFEYESACPLNTSSGSMKGTYQMVSEEGETFSVDVPEFYLIAPQALH